MTATEPPGPRGRRVLGCLPDFGADPLGTLLAGWKQHGDVVRFRGPVRPADMYLVAHPEHLDRVLRTEHLSYPHTASFDARFGASGGFGIVTAEGQRWQEERTALEPVLAPDRVAALVPAVATEALAELDLAVPAGAALRVDLQQVMARLSLRMLGTVLFGAGWREHGAALTRGVQTFIGHVSHKLALPFNVPERIPTRRNRRFLAARAEYDDAIRAVVALRMEQGPVDAVDVIGSFAEAQGRLGRDDTWLRDQLTNHWAAGHATVQAVAAWTGHLLGRNPDVQQAVREEASAVLTSDVPTAAELDRLELTVRVLKESMRLYPPLSLQPRSPVEDDEFDGHRIPAGAPLFISSYLTHRHPEFWPEAEAFAPQRFAPGGSASSAPGAYWPFSHGPRSCIGEALAMVELPLALGLLLRRHRIELEPRLPVRTDLGIALEPVGGIPVRLVPTG